MIYRHKGLILRNFEFDKEFLKLFQVSCRIIEHRKSADKKILEYGKINEQIDPQGMKEEQKVKCCLKTPKYLLEKPRGCPIIIRTGTLLHTSKTIAPRVKRHARGQNN